MKTILIVDDELTGFFDKMFRAHFDVVVLTAKSGEEASQIFGDNWSLDYILTDNNMPNGTGIDLIQMVRTYDEEIPITLMSGTPLTEKEQEILTENNVRFLQKPIDVAKEFTGIFERKTE